ncbi:60S ribosomal protein L5-1-like [Triticum aestivum]|uniref:60S ribosomal protein L5-1-like n=1 Tax=Triticum aestivum TaxID=4565 RepID=UPI001D012E25|nr:60S ribosomal protein L5-1-like [Triticum aestivum]
MCNGRTAACAVVQGPQRVHNGDSMHLLRTATLPFSAQQKQGCRGGSVARKSRKIGRRGFHIPLLHLQVFLSRISMGALDGGLDIPHSDKRFVGFKKDEKQLDTEINRNYIYEDHVANYMKSIADAEPEKYQFHFSEYIKKGIAADDMEALHKKVHATIRADPTMAKSTEEPPKTHKRYNLKKQ